MKESKSEALADRSSARVIILEKQSGVAKAIGIRREPFTGKILPPVTPGVVKC